MVTHAAADSDMSIVFFSLMINDKKKIIRAGKGQTIGDIVESQLPEDICYTKPCCVFVCVHKTYIKKNNGLIIKMNTYYIATNSNQQWCSL